MFQRMGRNDESNVTSRITTSRLYCFGASNRISHLATIVVNTTAYATVMLNSMPPGQKSNGRSASPPILKETHETSHASCIVQYRVSSIIAKGGDTHPCQRRCHRAIRHPSCPTGRSMFSLDVRKPGGRGTHHQIAPLQTHPARMRGQRSRRPTRASSQHRAHKTNAAH